MNSVESGKFKQGTERMSACTLVDSLVRYGRRLERRPGDALTLAKIEIIREELLDRVMGLK